MGFELGWAGFRSGSGRNETIRIRPITSFNCQNIFVTIGLKKFGGLNHPDPPPHRSPMKNGVGSWHILSFQIESTVYNYIHAIIRNRLLHYITCIVQYFTFVVFVA